MKRKSSPLGRRSTPSLIEGAVQNCFSTSRADFFMFRWSHTFVKMMNQEPSDIMTRTIKVARVTILPLTHRGIRP